MRNNQVEAIEMQQERVDEDYLGECSGCDEQWEDIRGRASAPWLAVKEVLIAPRC